MKEKENIIESIAKIAGIWLIGLLLIGSIPYGLAHYNEFKNFTYKTLLIGEILNLIVLIFFIVVTCRAKTVKSRKSRAKLVAMVFMLMILLALAIAMIHFGLLDLSN